jgi:hypothetical protein
MLVKIIPLEIVDQLQNFEYKKGFVFNFAQDMDGNWVSSLEQVEKIEGSDKFQIIEFKPIPYVEEEE